MKIISEKLLQLQDSKYKIIPSTNHETSIFLSRVEGELLKLRHDGDFEFTLNEQNIIDLLIHTYSYARENDIYSIQGKENFDSTLFLRQAERIRTFFATTGGKYQVKTSINGNRYYLKDLAQGNGFNFRDLLIGGRYKLVFKEDKNVYYADVVSVTTISTDVPQEREGSFRLIEHGVESTPKSPYYNKNVIWYGAPGTGKSYTITQLTGSVPADRLERITFHPDYDYASFIGGYKPVTEKTDEGKDEIRYKFVPQVFTSIYIKAWQNPSQEHFLIIEEINRGNCAEIFGDIFQLLDRNPDYRITPSRELAGHLEQELGASGFGGFADGKMSMPENLTIMASMNTSDQSLFPMDSAFKRRWEWEYVPISYPVNHEDESSESYAFRVRLGEGQTFSWIDFIKRVNTGHIKENPSLGMDKYLGNYFVKGGKNNEISLEEFINKVVFYLWNDVFKDENNQIFQDRESFEDFFPIENSGRKLLSTILGRIDVDIAIETDAQQLPGEEDKHNTEKQPEEGP